MRVFLAVVLLVWTGMHIYVSWRASSVPVIARHLPPGPSHDSVEVLGENWIGVLFLLLVALLAIDLVTVFGFALPRFAPSLRGLSLVVGGVLGVVALVQGLRALVVQNHEVQLAGLPASSDATVLILASDFEYSGERWISVVIVKVALRQTVVSKGRAYEWKGNT